MLAQLGSKTPTETTTIFFDFTGTLVGTLSSPSVAKSTIVGNDPGAASLTVGSPSISGGVVSVVVAAGTNDCSYELLCTGSGTGGLVYQRGAVITTTTAAA